MESNGLVSVVVPTHDSSEHLAQCLDSLLGQTYQELEVICVDDGSTDDTVAMLRAYQERDGRVVLITQENAGPGAARNRGIEAAHGRWLYFLDSDDWVEPWLIEHAVSRLEETGAQIAIFPYYDFDERVGNPYATIGIVLEDAYAGDVFDWRQNPDWIFRAMQNLMWNKVFRMDFVREHRLRCQTDVRLTEDLMFTAPALVLADKLTFLHERAVYHRAGTGTNTMAHKDAHPLDFYTAFLTFKAWLRDEGVWDELEVAYANWAVDSCLYNLRTLHSLEGFRLVYGTLADEGLGRLGLLDVPSSAYHERRFIDFIEQLQSETVEEHLFRLFSEYQESSDYWWYGNAVAHVQLDDEVARREAAQEEVARLQAELAALRGSASFRLGNAVVKPAAKLRDALKRDS